MQRTGRKGSAQFRVVVQDSQRTPTSGNIVALVGNYDPHAKVTNIDKEKIKFYLSNGAQPSDRVIRILQQEKVEIPSWVKLPTNKTGKVKNLDKLRKNRPDEEKVEEPVAELADPEVVKSPSEETVETITEATEPDITGAPEETIKEEPKEEATPAEAENPEEEKIEKEESEEE
jgi:small subunit ribosomal protein S16